MSDLGGILSNQKNPVLLKAFVYQNAITIVIGLGILVAFSILRPNNGAIYNRRHKLLDKSKKFPKIGKGYFDWIKPVWKTTEQEILETCGLDAVMFLRFVKLIITYGISSFFFGLAVTIINFVSIKQTFENSLNKPFEVKGDFDLQNFSIAQSVNQNFFWAHVIFGWTSLLLVSYFLYRNNAEFIKLRQEYFQSKEYQCSLSSRTLMMTFLPDDMQDPNKLRSFIKGLGLRYEPLHYTVIPKVAHLPSLIRDYNRSIRDLETSLTRYFDKSNKVLPKRPTHKVEGVKVDSIDYYIEKILELRSEIKELRDYVDNLPPSSVGFISFQDAFSAHVAMQELELGVGSKLIGPPPLPDVSLAPKAEDIIWNNAQFSREEAKKKGLFFSLITIVIIVGSIVPIAIITAPFANTGYFRVLFNDESLFSDTASKVFIEGILSPIIVISTMLGMQFILRKMSIYQGATTHTFVDRRVLTRYFSFLLINYLVFFNLIASIPAITQAFKTYSFDKAETILASIQKLISEIGQQISQGVIRTSAFWANQLSVKSLSYMFELLQVISLSRRYIQKYLLRYSPRDLKEFSQPQPFEYSVLYANQCFNFSIMLLFAVPAPLVIPFGIVNSIIAYFVYKHQLMYVYQTNIETGGRLWKTAFNRIVASLILSQFFLMIVFVLVKATNMQLLCITPLPFITIVASILHQAWVDSKVNYIDWRSPFRNPQERKNGGSPIDFNTQFNHPAFNQELLTLEVEPSIISAIPKLKNLEDICNTNSTKFKSPDSRCATPNSEFSQNSIDPNILPSNGSMIELLDRNSQPQKVTHF